MFRKIIATLAIPAAIAAVACISTAASAAVDPHVAYSTNEAGYQNPQSGWRFRDVQASTYLRTITQNADVHPGVHLANPSNGDEVAEALTWNGTTYTPIVSINGETSDPFASDLVISAHDTVRFEIYYSTSSHWVTFRITDQTSGTERTANLRYGYALWYSAGAGVQDTRTLGAAGTTVLAAFTKVTETSYNGTHGSLSGRWNAQEVVATANGGPPSSGNVETILPGSLGTGFKVSEGAVSSS